jgi:phosphoribosyl-AMP cyclohydrolase
MKTVKVQELDWEKMGGVLPVVAQSAETLEVLTLAYVNREAVEKTMETGYAHYFRRSHGGQVMMKGVTSGNTQRIQRVLTDCDSDALVYLVSQKGPACHLGERTCFHKEVCSKP